MTALARILMLCIGMMSFTGFGITTSDLVQNSTTIDDICSAGVNLEIVANNHFEVSGHEISINENQPELVFVDGLQLKGLSAYQRQSFDLNAKLNFDNRRSGFDEVANTIIKPPLNSKFKSTI